MDLKEKFIEALEEIKFPNISSRATLQSWKARAINIVTRIYGENSNQQKQIEDIKFQNYMSITTFDGNGRASSAGGGNNSNICQKQATELIESFISDIQKFGLPHKEKSSEERNTINVSVHQNQSQTQKQTIKLDIIINALQDELSGKQLAELQEVMNEEETNLEKKQNKILQKLQGFGKDLASNILANILANPALYS
ncbi:hypothetical protein [Flavobacterium sp. TBRC 19031]|uniref:hypothetical protein n=1 Tax=Flavobacterium mekongense TaxID=3379707 RepID=UPI00399C2AA7